MERSEHKSAGWTYPHTNYGDKNLLNFIIGVGINSGIDLRSLAFRKSSRH